MANQDEASKNPLFHNPQFTIQYLDSLLNPRLWLDIADKLLEASKVLEPLLHQFWSVVITNEREAKYNKGEESPYKSPPNLNGPYFILISYALEDLLKALIIQEQGEEIRHRFLQRGTLPKLLDEHNLVVLSNRAKFDISFTEEDTLSGLSRQSKWKGRYPVPFKLDDMRNLTKYSNGKSYFVDYYTLGDLNIINAIIKRARNKVLNHGD
jgi:hypothetical protein